jgi:hypothetical protein
LADRSSVTFSRVAPFLAVACAIASVVAFAPVSACSGSTGVPAAPSALESLGYDAGVSPVADARVSITHYERLFGRVRDGRSDAGIVGAFVVGEVGGLGPDGGPATVAVDSRIEDGEITIDAGEFAFARVPVGPVGLRVFEKGYLEGRSVVPTAASDASVAKTVVSLVSLSDADAGLPRADGGAVLRPTAKGLTASSAATQVPIAYVAPSEPVAFAVQVAAGTVDDPLSEDVILVQPSTGWAGALDPPTTAVPGGAYPDGIYSLIVEVPATVGVYTYTVVVASRKGVTSTPLSTVLTVTATGMPPAEAGLE